MPQQTDETDLLLLHALQIAPRARWSQIGEVVGISPTSAARRWSRLVERGEAWIAAYSGSPHSQTAFVEVDCDPGTARDTAESLAASTRAVTLEELSGARDLLATIATSSITDLSGYLRSVQTVPGVRSLRTSLTTALITDGSQWRLDALDTSQRRAMRHIARHESQATLKQPDQLDRQIAVALSSDGRVPTADLAQNLSVSINTVRRRLGRLLDTNWLTVRCDIAPAISGHEITATFWLRVPPQSLLESARVIAQLPQMRAVACITGPRNLLVIARLRHQADVPAFEVEMSTVAPQIRVADRAVTLRMIKHVGRLLDGEGRVCGVVPFDIWNPPPTVR